MYYLFLFLFFKDIQVWFRPTVLESAYAPWLEYEIHRGIFILVYISYIISYSCTHTGNYYGYLVN